MRAPRTERYVGIDQDVDGGMTDTGRIIRDAWAFGLIPETETCAGWNAQAIEQLWEKTTAEWTKYNHRVNDLPEDIRSRFLRIQQAAFARARAAGWDAEPHDDD